MAHLQYGFERNRIEVLKKQRENTQKKTFTKWINSHLDKVGLHCTNLYTDLRDGVFLLKLLQIISGDAFTINRGKLRLHMVENVSKSIKFLQMKKVRLEGIGPEDIVDGNPTLTLGLIWTIILRFQIENIVIETESNERKSANEALLFWCQMKTKGYPNVNIQNFTTSWRDGLAFNALIHKHRPELIDFDSLIPSKHQENLNNAFRVAERRLGIKQLLDAEDVDVLRPDDKSVMTYVAALYHYFSDMIEEETGAKRLQKMLMFLMEVDKYNHEYVRVATDLLKWIEVKIASLNDRSFPNSLPGLQKLLTEFNTYRHEEKPPKYAERVQLEEIFFNIQIQLREHKMKPWSPPDGLLISDVNTAWEHLESAEHEREKSLRAELIRQERLQQLADRFNRKATLCLSWIGDMHQVVQELDTSTQKEATSKASVEAAVKRHESIQTEVSARETRISTVREMSQELSKENYEGIAAVREKETQIDKKWSELLRMLETQKGELQRLQELTAVFHEMDECWEAMKQLVVILSSPDIGKHLESVQDLLNKHKLTETEISVMVDRVQNISDSVSKFLQTKHANARQISDREQEVKKMLEEVQRLSTQRRLKLLDNLKVHQFYSEADKEDWWLQEREPLAGSQNYGHDLTSVLNLQQKHQALEIEIQGHQEDFRKICRQGENLKEKAKFASRVITQRISNLKQKWTRVNELSSTRKQLLLEAEQYQGFFADANESESWIREREPLVTSSDFGRDKNSANNLLENHIRLEEEIRTYSNEVDRLKDLGTKISDSSSVLFSAPSPAVPGEGSEAEKTVTQEIEVEEQVMEEREVEEEVVNKVPIPQVVAMYAYTGQGMSFAKGDNFELCRKHNSDWWLVKRNDESKQGYVPANYVREIEPLIREEKSVQRVKVQVPVIVKRKKRVEKIQPSVRRDPTGAGSRMAGMVSKHRALDASSVLTRFQTINEKYEALEKCAVDRHQQLESYIKLFGFYRECGNLETWMREKSAFIKTEATEQFSNRDYVESLVNRFSKFVSDLTASESRCSQISSQADKLVREKHPQSSEIRQRQQAIAAMWDSLQQLREAQEKFVNLAQKIQRYYELCDESRLWIQEKDIALSSVDLGKDLPAVQALQRKHENLERELVPVEDKLASIHATSSRLRELCAGEAAEIGARHLELASMLEQLKSKAALRRKQLEHAYNMHCFLSELKELMEWVSEAKQKLASEEMPNDVMTAEEMLQQNEELRREITARQEKFDSLETLGKAVETSGVGDTQLIVTQAQLLTRERGELELAWSKRNEQLKEAKELQQFIRSADYGTTILNSQEAFLNSGDVGQDLAAVDTLIRQYEYFENKHKVQEEKIQAIITQADQLVRAGNFDTASINKRSEVLDERRKVVMVMLRDRKAQLESSKTWFEFNRMVEELAAWIQNKMVLAKDESYKDPSNIVRKIRKHEAFQAEIHANRAKLEEIKKAGEKLLQANHGKSPEIHRMLRELSQQWEDLETSTQDKTDKLEEADQQRVLFRSIDDELSWIKQVESQISGADTGKDLPGVKLLIKKHEQLESDCSVHGEQLDRLSGTGEGMVSKSYFNSELIQAKLAEYSGSVDSLRVGMAERREVLKQSSKLQEFLRHLDEQESWIREQMQAVASSDVGDSWHTVDTLIKKHATFENGLEAGEQRISQVIKEGDELCEEEHTSSVEIQEHSTNLKQQLKELKQLTGVRGQRLQESLEEQKYLLEANEADAWMNEKAGIASNTDYGKDEDVTNKMLRKHQELEKDVEAYTKVIQGLEKGSGKMLSQGHFNSDNIMARQAALNEQLSGLQTLITVRKERLVESLKLHQFIREVDDCLVWISKNLLAATSEDFGKDFKQAQTLKKEFDDFIHDLNANADIYNSVDNLARKLVFEGHSDTVSIKDLQDNLRSEWNQLQNAITTRTNKLEVTLTILKFVSESQDIRNQITDKTALLTQTDIGANLSEVERRQRKLETSEVEVTALGKQVQELSTRALHLQTMYPGGRGEGVKDTVREVNDAWEKIQHTCLKRKEDLKAALEFFKFSDTVKNIVLYCGRARSLIQTEDPINTVAEANALITKHTELKTEIDTRMEEINNITKNGSKLISQGSYAANDIRGLITQLQNEANTVKTEWSRKERRLHESLQLQQFFKDAASVDVFSSRIEVYIANEDLPSTVDEADALLKKHDSVHKNVVAQEGKVRAFREFVDSLLSANHSSKTEIQQRHITVFARREKNLQDMSRRLSKLEAAKELRILFRDILDVISWISEKQRVIGERDFTNLSNLESKVRKHQEFEAELDAHDQLIGSLCSRGEVMIGEEHFAREEIEKELEELINRWEDLQDLTQRRGHELDETCQLSEYFKLVETWREWIGKKQAFVSQDETGRDLKHCTTLLRNFDIFYNELESDVKQLDVVGMRAGELLKAKHSKADVIQEKFEDLKSQWDQLCAETKQRLVELEGASKVHSFMRDLHETDMRIAEKLLSISSDLGIDLEGVEMLQRKHDRLELDISAIEKSLEQLNADADRLSEAYPESAPKMEERFNTVIMNWEAFCDKADERKARLADSLQYQKFLSDGRDLLSWYQKMGRMVMANELAKDVPAAERQLEVHQERKIEIDNRRERFSATITFGESLCEAGHYAAEVIRVKMQELELEKSVVLESWNYRNEEFKQCLDLERFLKSAEEIEKILSSREAFLHGGELGNSLDRVRVLIRQQDAFEKSVRAQDDKVQSLLAFGSKLVTGGDHYEVKKIAIRRDNIEGRYFDIQALALERKQKLEDSLKLQKFLRDINELQGWIELKTQIASEENYKDRTNLQIKLQKHEAVEAELAANKVRYEQTCETGAELIRDNHYANMEIETHIRNLEILWSKMQEKSDDKGRKLRESIEFKEFKHKVEDIDVWVEETRVALSSEDLGKDSQSIASLIKRQDQLTIGIDTHHDLIQELIDQVNKFRTAKHFLITQIEDLSQALVERYGKLEAPSAHRRLQLEESKKLHIFSRDVADELNWIREKEKRAGSSDTGRNLSSVQNLLKLHQALESDVASHDPIVSSVISAAQQMVMVGHYSEDVIQKKREQLEREWSGLKGKIAERSDLLGEALEVQKYYTEALESEAWMGEKVPILASGDYGADQLAVDNYIKELRSTGFDVEAHEAVLTKLARDSKAMLDRSHYDSENIRLKLERLEALYAEVKGLVRKRESRLDEKTKYFKFIAEVEEFEDLVEEKAVHTASEDVGESLERCDIILKRFSNFKHGLSTMDERVNVIKSYGEALLSENHTDSDEIRTRLGEMSEVWTELQLMVAQRGQSLADAREVHSYTQDADETIAWILEKDRVLTFEDYGSDVTTVQAMMRKHEGVERDLAALEDKLAALSVEAARLQSKRPGAKVRAIKNTENEVNSVWSTLKNKSRVRRDKLQQSEKFQKFVNDYMDLISFLTDLSEQVRAAETVTDVTSAESLLRRQSEYRAEIEARKVNIDTFLEQGRLLISERNLACKEIGEKTESVESAYNDLTADLSRKKGELEQELDTQVYLKEAEHLDLWLKHKEEVLEVGDLDQGGRLDEMGGQMKLEHVEEMLKRQEDLEKMLQSNEEKIKSLMRETDAEQKERIAREREEEELERIEEKRRTELEEAERLEVVRQNERRAEEERLSRVRERELERKKQETLIREREMDQEATFIPDPVMTFSETEIPPPHIPSSGRPEQESEIGRERAEHLVSTVYSEGVLQRKNMLDVGGRKSAIRAWKSYYVVLKGPRLSFYRDKKDFLSESPAVPPINVLHGTCNMAVDYTKKRNVLRLALPNGSEYLFMAPDPVEEEKWVLTINRSIQDHSLIDPSLLDTLQEETIPNLPQSPPPPVEFEQPESLDIARPDSDPYDPSYLPPVAGAAAQDRKARKTRVWFGKKGKDN